jgi:hypothetical protein
MDTEVILALGYSGFLVAVSAMLEAVARYAHRRAQTSNSQGFTYIPERDLWRCPNGQHLYREKSDDAFRIVRYRAQPHHCNNCGIKSRCTDSDTGRVLEHRSESWLESGMRRFHRGMSLALLVLAILILSIEIVRHNDRVEQVVLAGLVVCLGVAGVRLSSSLRYS